MFNFKQTENENQEYVFPDNFSRIMLASFYLLLIAAGFVFYYFAVIPEIERVKLLDFSTRYEIMGQWIKLVLGFFLIPSAIMVIFGIKVVAENRYPSIGARVAVKTKIIRGKKARNLGIKYLILGLFTIALIFTSMDRTLKMQKSFLENPLKWASPKSWEKAGLRRPDF